VKFYRRCSDCDDEKTCEVRRLMREVRDAASAILDNTSLAEAAAQNPQSQVAAQDGRLAVGVVAPPHAAKSISVGHHDAWQVLEVEHYLTRHDAADQKPVGAEPINL
jgi:hypothetical protein